MLQEAGLVVTPRTFAKQLVRMFGKVLRCVGRGNCVSLKIRSSEYSACMSVFEFEEHSDELGL